MIKLQALEDFSLRRFNELKNIVRKNINKNEEGMLYEGDIFECEKELADYLCGNNPLNKKVVTILEVTLKEKVETKFPEVEEKVISNKKKKSKRSKK